LEIKPKEKVEFEAEETPNFFVDNTYFVPIAKNHPSIDSILPPDTVFQMTVSTVHSVNIGGLYVIQNILHPQEEISPSIKKINLYFVVPPDIFDSFKKQNYVDKRKKIRGWHSISFFFLSVCNTGVLIVTLSSVRY
jgi:hypothetical protein